MEKNNRYDKVSKLTFHSLSQVKEFFKLSNDKNLKMNLKISSQMMHSHLSLTHKLNNNELMR